ncbi:uncharacterized protein LOC122089476 [Macadamia integrifolia]|uniref:uncharacterized protein LOC122089476 n=1 Tax=Macadamia integrifolia TaxID=60698 RepID=UPI001C4E85DD|nr:uncharacterized protein LOC122089476 [Macadamia integrifolia]
MLQWMGGSRRKVTTSRKSTEKRQRQYFEQRKRQKQTAELGNFSDEMIPCGQQVQLHDKPQSLDILSLLNLKRVTEESNSGCTTAKENPVINDSPVYLKCGMPSIPKKVSRRQSVDLKEAKNVPSNRQLDTESPKNFPSPSNYSSDGNGDKLDYWRTATENQLSILDVLGDDGPNSNAEESPIREAHVAFSVEGLGIVGMETPVCSPRPSGRILFDGCSSPPRAVKRFHSSKDFTYIMDDEGLELNAMIHDINMPFGGNSSKIPSKPRNTVHQSGNPKNKKFTFQGCMQPDPDDNQIDYFPGEEKYLCNDMAKYGFLTGNNVDERKYGVHWGSRSDQTDCDLDNLLGNRKQIHQSSPADEDFYVHCMRDAERAVSHVNILGPPSLHSEDPASDKEYFCVSKDKPRYTSLDANWDFGTCTDQPAWSFMTEDAVDSMSLLSEESCSSSAVRGDKCYNSAPNSSRMKKRMPRQGNDVCRSSENNYGVENLYAEETQNQNKDEIQHGNNVEVPGKYPSVPKQMRSKLEDYSKELYTVQENPRQQPRWPFVDEYSSADKDLGLGSFCTAEAEPMSLDLEFFSEDRFNISSSSKRSKFDVTSKCAYATNEKAAVQQPPSPKNSYGSPIFSNTESSSKKPDVSPAARTEGKPPDSSDAVDFLECIEVQDVSRWESISKYHEEKSEFQHTYCGNFFEEIQKEISMGKFELTSENDKVSSDIEPNDNCGECNVANDNTREQILKSKTSSPDHAEDNSSSIKDKPGKLEETTDVKKCQFDALVHLASPNWTKEKDPSRPKRRNTEGNGQNGNVSPTYQIMLQSYVQLLCVQKGAKRGK